MGALPAWRGVVRVASRQVVCRDLMFVEPLTRSSKLVAVGRNFRIGASHSLLSCLNITRVLRLEITLIHLRAPYAIGMLLALMPAAVVRNGPKKHKPIRMAPDGKGPLSFARNDVWFLDANNRVIPTREVATAQLLPTFVGLRWRFQKNGDNGETKTFAENPETDSTEQHTHTSKLSAVKASTLEN
jgi:hypothetical protein